MLVPKANTVVTSNAERVLPNMFAVLKKITVARAPTRHEKYVARYTPTTDGSRGKINGAGATNANAKKDRPGGRADNACPPPCVTNGCPEYSVLFNHSECVLTSDHVSAKCTASC